jgi:hypothetical protein
MRIPTYAVLVFSAMLLVGAVHGANVTIGPTQGHVEYRIIIYNQNTTVASFFLNESAQPTGQNGIVQVTANLISTLRNFTYSRALNTSSFPEVFPYLLGIGNQSFFYHTYGVSLNLHIVNTGSAQITFNGQTFQGTRYQVTASATYASTTGSVSAYGTIITMPSGLVYSVQLESVNSYSVQIRLEETNLALLNPSNSSSLPIGIALVSLGLLGAAVFAVPSIFKRLKNRPAETPSTPGGSDSDEKPPYWVD